MRLIDADELKKDDEVIMWLSKDPVRTGKQLKMFSEYFINKIDNMPTVNAIPIKALYELKSEVEKHISQPRGYIKEVYEMGKDNAYENVLELIDMKILEYGGDTDE